MQTTGLPNPTQVSSPLCILFCFSIELWEYFGFQPSHSWVAVSSSGNAGHMWLLSIWNLASLNWLLNIAIHVTTKITCYRSKFQPGTLTRDVEKLITFIFIAWWNYNIFIYWWVPILLHNQIFSLKVIWSVAFIFCNVVTRKYKTIYVDHTVFLCPALLWRMDSVNLKMDKLEAPRFHMVPAVVGDCLTGNWGIQLQTFHLAISCCWLSTASVS